MRDEMVMKKTKKALVDNASPPYVIDQEAMNLFKRQSLFEEFRVLHMETEELKKRLEKAKRKKLRLLAEVRFLKRRYNVLSKYPSGNIHSDRPIQSQISDIRNHSSSKERNPRDKEASTRGPPAKERNPREKEASSRAPPVKERNRRDKEASSRAPPMKERNPRDKEASNRVPPGKERNPRDKEASTRGPPTIDLNQISRGEETEDYIWEPMRMEKKMKRPLVEGDMIASDLKLVFRDGNGSRSGKRKISWQDQLALRA